MSGDGGTTYARLIKAQNKVLRGKKREHTGARYFLSCENCGGVILNVTVVQERKMVACDRERREAAARKKNLSSPKKRKEKERTM